MGGSETATTATPRTTKINDFDRDTLRAVALAYREKRQAGFSDHPSFMAAMTVYRKRHPEVEEWRVAEVIPQMIAAAINADPEWFWRDVPSEFRWPAAQQNQEGFIGDTSTPPKGKSS